MKKKKRKKKRRRRKWGRAADPVQKELMFSHSGRWFDEQKSHGERIVSLDLKKPCGLEQQQYDEDV